MLQSVPLRVMWGLRWSSVVEHVLRVLKVLGSIPSSRERDGARVHAKPWAHGCWVLPVLLGLEVLTQCSEMAS